MKLEEFRNVKPATDEWAEISEEFDKVIKYVDMQLRTTLLTYNMTDVAAGMHVGSGPMGQFCSEIVKEFIRNYEND